ncbi:uncharacterized protein [Montipora capricornis]|uniref:uncharacterized protein isoform X2 n=1 Tax=Montipora capricornis TaxID=246305 RepID=UPI0035F1E398
MKKITDFYTKKSGPAQSRPEQSASNEGIQEESSCSAPPKKLPKLSISDDQAGVSEIEEPQEIVLHKFSKRERVRFPTPPPRPPRETQGGKKKTRSWNS